MKGDVRVLSEKRSPAGLGQSGLSHRFKTFTSEGAFNRPQNLGRFEMTLRGDKKYLKEICEKVDQDLSSPTCRQLREHLSTCPFCSAYYDSLKETILLYRKYDEKLRGSRVKKILSHLKISESSGKKCQRKNRLKSK